MGELINLADYREKKENEFLALLIEELQMETESMSFLTEEDMLFFQMFDMGICPCCGQQMPPFEE